MKRKMGFVGVAIIFFTLAVLIFIQFTPSHQAKSVVEKFYEYEQDARFSESWSLFHSQMKSKFEKGQYIQDRAHVFMNHFGVTTFSYQLGGVDKKTEWTMEKGAKKINKVYQVTVTQTFKGKYGRFDLVQDVYAAKENGEWKVLWNYSK